MQPEGGGPDTFFKLLGLTYKACVGKKFVWLPDCDENLKVCLAIRDIDYDQCVKNGGFFCGLAADLATAKCNAEYIGCKEKGLQPGGKPIDTINIDGIVINIYNL
jgi:hypothetical protein